MVLCAHRASSSHVILRGWFHPPLLQQVFEYCCGSADFSIPLRVVLRVLPVASCPVPHPEFSTTPGLLLPLSSDMSDYDYDFLQFGHWDGHSASYYEEYNHYTPPGPSRQSSQPHRLPSPLTPLASPSAFVQEFVQGSSTSGTQYEYTLADIHGGNGTGFGGEQVPLGLRGHKGNSKNRLKRNGEQKGESSESATQGIRSPEEHPHLYTAVYSTEGESWRPASVTIQEHFSHIPLASALAWAPLVFLSITPFHIPPPHLYTLFPRLINPTNTANFPPLYICSKVILDSPSVNLPLGSVRYDFCEGIWQAFFPLSNILRVGYIDSLVTLEVQDFLDRRVITTYGHLHFTFDGQVFALYQGYFFEDLIRSNPLLLSHCLTPHVPADPFAFVLAIPDSHPL
ncbi:hypothetical protein EDB89DRAFT_1901955 [Lactarius sanguifluus]|nr:hypothetical protein EDB89DRAFT_1901955 [Lactarius sanguifluus]